MFRHYYDSEHKDSHIAFWMHASIHQLDTHVLWSAEVFTRRDDSPEVKSFRLFNNYFSDAEVLHEFIKRGIITKVEKNVKKHILDGAWEELEQILDACLPIITIPLSDEAVEHGEKYREPNLKWWFEVIIDTFTEETVRFSFSALGTKYLLKDLQLPKQLFYLFADRLDVKIRFVNDWFPLQSTISKIASLLDFKNVLSFIRDDLTHEINLLRIPTDTQIKSSCRSLFPLLEKLLRSYSNQRNWAGATKSLDPLINQFSNNQVLSNDTIELLRFIAKPKRDYIEHGRDLPLSVGKLVLVTILELFVRISGEIDV